jgi:hypothetical protein
MSEKKKRDLRRWTDLTKEEQDAKRAVALNPRKKPSQAKVRKVTPRTPMERVNGEWVPAKEFAVKRKETRGRPKGTGSKLTFEDAMLIRKLAEKHIWQMGGDGSMTWNSIAKMFPITRQMVFKIAHRECWDLDEINDTVAKLKERDRKREERRKKKRDEEKDEGVEAKDGGEA